MVDIKKLTPGMELDNYQLCAIFGCSPQGGMRRSHHSNTLIIVSNHIESIYDDRWLGDIFHYTGMGTKGDQSLLFKQNKTLSESRYNGVEVHLFEVFKDRVYTYIGAVELAGEPYSESQSDANGDIRKVWVFPLQLKSGEVPTIGFELIEEVLEIKAKKARRLNDQDIESRAKRSNKRAGIRRTEIQQYERNPWVAEYAKRRARGICQLCEQPAPFKNRLNEAYLETHHIIWLANGGDDSVDNTVALCPNCHRKMHVLNLNEDARFLLNKLAV